MKTFTQKIVAVGAGVFLTANMAVYGIPLYDNSTTDKGSNLTFVNGTQIGNEITMGTPSPFNLLTSFSFEIYSPEHAFIGSPQMEVFLYANNGAPFNGFPTPSQSLYDSGLFSITTPFQATAGNSLGSTIQVDLSGAPLTVPHDFTFAVEVTGLNASDYLGMELFDPATVGQNFGDYWLKSGSSGSVWELDHNLNGTRTDFGAQFLGSAIPDPAPTAMLLGMALASLGFLRRKFC
jgi:hypothetical protein